ncbi:homoprotocatechuate degradation operon regulator HpaR [Paracoccus sp. (in: a-proteobacteria)]|uniref:homoprotocatechuate degradation operon regulator HpaR n=1 Tax=Paracoccus sp. TaxID=267 RepID=UPI003A845DD3
MTDDGILLARTRRSLPMALLRARETVMERFRPMLNTHGVTEQQWRVMRVLEEGDALDATALAAAACILPPSLTRMLKTLEARGVIEISRDPEDARRSRISLTGAGRSFIATVSPESAAIYAGIEARLGQDRIARLLDELEDLLDAMQRPD